MSIKNRMLNNCQLALVDDFIKDCYDIDLGENKEISIGKIYIIVYKDEEFGNLFNVYTYKNDINVDDSLGIDINWDLRQLIIDNLTESREFELAG